MPTIAKATIYLSAIALGTVVVNFHPLPANAQSQTADSFNFNELSVGDKRNWNFSSEDETVSVRDNLEDLKKYDASRTRNFDIRKIRQNRRRLGIKRWGNTGDRSYYSLDDGFYPYYFRENRIYDY